MHSTTPGSDSRTPRSISPLLPVMPMAVHRDPGIGCALRPRLSMRLQTARTCSSVAWDCMTTSMEGPRFERLSLRQAAGASQIFGILQSTPGHDPCISTYEETAALWVACLVEPATNRAGLAF